ncbi:MAG: hypothetical protein U0R68_17450 [Candidatus Nanopelagicales bacterium]
MSRTTRRRAIRAVAPVAGLLAAGLLVWQGSYAAFSATTANGANNWAAGSVSLTDDDAAVAMFSTALVTPAGAQDTKALKPGDTRTNCIKVTNNGTLAGPVKLYVQTYAQTSGLGDNLTVTVEQGTGTAATAFGNCTGFNPLPSGGTLVNAQTLTAFAGANSTFTNGVGGANLAVGASTYYRFTTTVNAGAPNSVQGGTATATFQWELQA